MLPMLPMLPLLPPFAYGEPCNSSDRGRSMHMRVAIPAFGDRNAYSVGEG